MNCTSCGVELDKQVRFCHNCGAFVENLFENQIRKQEIIKKKSKVPPALKKEFNAKSPLDRVGMSLIYENVRLDILNRSDLQKESNVILLFTALIYSIIEVMFIKIPGIGEIGTILFSIALFILFFISTYFTILIVHGRIDIKIISRMLAYPLLISTVVIIVFMFYYPIFLVLAVWTSVLIGFLVAINYVFGAFIFVPFLRTLMDGNSFKSFIVFTVSYAITIFTLIEFIHIFG